jgi:hypothetical protein
MANDSRCRVRGLRSRAARTLLALALAFAGGASAQDAQSYEELILSCSEQDAADAVGIEQLEEQCPGLEEALIETGYDAFLSASQLDALTVHGLVDLGQLARRYRQPPGSADALEPAALESILVSLQREQPVENAPGWYARLKKWLRNMLRQADGQSDSWLSRWLDDVEMSQATRNVIFYGAIAMVILLAIAVLVNELRAAGFGRGGRRKRGELAAQSAETVRDPYAMTLADLDALPLHEQPSMLLRMVAAQLMKTGRLRSERSLTHRELARAAAFEAEAEQACFGRVAGMAETLRYGQHPVPSPDIESVVRDGRALSARLAEAESAA